MIVKNDLELELVYADTQKAFKEFTDKTSGNVYAEVEPDVEYYIKISSRRTQRCLVDVQLDNKKIEERR